MRVWKRLYICMYMSKYKLDSGNFILKIIIRKRDTFTAYKIISYLIFLFYFDLVLNCSKFDFEIYVTILPDSTKRRIRHHRTCWRIFVLLSSYIIGNKLSLNIRSSFRIIRNLANPIVADINTFNTMWIFNINFFINPITEFVHSWRHTQKQY